jgi:2-polyprenyl-6-methoxyphenol hydroxylase-like FAD-dependent oxidoreductase
MRVEISVESVDGGRIAAARVELCAGLSDGGLTPNAALIEAAAEGLETTFHRAIDVSADSRQALDRLADLDFTRRAGDVSYAGVGVPPRLRPLRDRPGRGGRTLRGSHRVGQRPRNVIVQGFREILPDPTSVIS